MTEKPERTEQSFEVVFEALEAAKMAAPHTSVVQLVEVLAEDAADWARIDELRRLSEALAEPELRTYTAS